jgi:hypothetical protein
MKHLKWVLLILGTVLYATNLIVIVNNTSHALHHTFWDFAYCGLTLLSIIIIGGSSYLILLKKEKS